MTCPQFALTTSYRAEAGFLVMCDPGAIVAVHINDVAKRQLADLDSHFGLATTPLRGRVAHTLLTTPTYLG